MKKREPIFLLFVCVYAFAWHGCFPASRPASPEGDATRPIEKYDTEHDQEFCFLTVALAGAGGGNVTPAPGAYRFRCGETVALEATPTEADQFGGWHVISSLDDSELRRCSDAVQEIVMRGDMVAIAWFEAANSFTLPDSATGHVGRTYTVRIEAAHDGGTLTPPPGVYRIADQTVIELEAAPPEGKAFYHWTRDGDIVIAGTAAAQIFHQVSS